MSDVEYFAQRARTERQLSESAADPCAAAIHARMAACYEDLATGRELKARALHSPVKMDARYA